MRQILVTGSAGRIGRRVVDALLARGDLVTGFDLRASGISHGSYREVVGSFGDDDAVEQATRGAAAVVHLGAFMSWLPADAARVHTTNVDGTYRLLAAAAAADAPRFVFASTGEVYPEVRAKTDPIDETHPREPISAYGLSKLLGEEMVAFFARTRGLATTILRFAHTQEARELLDPESFFSGPRFYLRAKIRQQRAFGNAAALSVLEPLDDGRERLLVQCSEAGVPYRMMIADARDMADGVVAALDSEAAIGGTLNLGPDAPVDFDRAVALLAAATRLPVVRAHLPGPPVHYTTSNARARAVLGFRPRWTFAAMVDDACRTPTSASR